MALQVFFARPDFLEHERTIFLYIPVESAADAGLLEFGLFDNRIENGQHFFSFFRGDKYADARMDAALVPLLIFPDG
jgi:hypothetical protein